MRGALLLAALLAAGCLAPSGGEGDVLTLGTTTTTQDSGVLDAILPTFERDSGIRVRAVVGGSGEILAKAARGDVDALLAHSPDAERALVAAGHGTYRKPVMHSRFLLVGPPDDPADARGATSARDAFLRVHDHRHEATFASRGDESGTHAKEMELWRAAGLDPAAFDPSWHKETGAGQAQTLLYADETGAYALTDEGTWGAMRANGKLPRLAALFADDPEALRNRYSVIPVDAQRHPGVRQDLAEAFAAWITGPRGQEAIAAFRVGGAQAFVPDAHEQGA